MRLKLRINRSVTSRWCLRQEYPTQVCLTSQKLDLPTPSLHPHLRTILPCFLSSPPLSSNFHIAKGLALLQILVHQAILSRKQRRFSTYYRTVTDPLHCISTSLAATSHSRLLE